MEKIDLKKIERNIYRDFFQDGLADILLGGYFLLIGLSLPVGGFALVFIAMVVFYLPLLRGFKKRVTYLRTGYAELRQGDPSPLPFFSLGSLVLGLITLIAVLIVVGVIAQPDQWYRWIPIFFGIVMAGVFLGLGLNVRLVRYYVVAGVALVSGPCVALIPMVGKLDNIGRFFAIMGAVVLALGVFALVRFLRKYPLLEKGGSDVTD